MGYENAPGTAMLATHCACCARPLLDAKSVEIGMGPICRKKHGYGLVVSDEARVAANKLVYLIALRQQGFEVLQHTAALRVLGFEKLAGIIEKRVAPIRVLVVDGEVRIVTPYNEYFVARIRQIPGRRWHKEEKVWSVPLTQRRALWTALGLHFEGQLGIGPKGGFVVAVAA